jgi:F-type H+-transporting ATPase subunit epsilon
VKRIVAQTLRGAVGFLPHRLDCATALTPGILIYETQAEGEFFLAIDQGVLIKAGAEVLVSVRNAIGGTDLGNLHEAVKREFLEVDAQEKTVRSALAKMESGFIRRFMRLSHE